MQIRRITLSNLHSIRDRVEVDFTKSPLSESGLFAITGDTGAGKTTILDAITLAIYGNVCRQADAREVLSHGATEGYAECEFEAKGRIFLSQWRVRQTKSKKPGQAIKTDRSVAEWDSKTEEFHVVAERKVREVNNFVEEVTGLDFARFTRSVMLAQGDFAAFLKANEKERSDLLERITGTEIYSELSIAALERKNIEKAKLDALAEKRESLKILSTDEVKEKKKNLKEKQQAHKNQTILLDKTRAGLNQLNQIEKLEKSEQVFGGELEKITAQLKGLEPSIKQLQLHQKAQPLYPTLARFEDKELDINSSNAKIKVLTESIEQLEVEVKNRKQAYDHSRIKFEEKKKEQPTTFKLIDQIIALDIKIGGLDEQYQKQVVEYKSIKKQQLKEEKNILDLEQKITEATASLKLLEEWISKNKQFESLSNDLPTISHIRSELNRNFILQEELKKKEIDSESKLKSAQKQKSEIEKNLKIALIQQEQLISEFTKTSPPEFSQNRTDLLEKLNTEIERISTNQNKLSQLASHNTSYEAIIADINFHEEELRNLRSEELMLDKAFLTATELCEEAESALKFKKEIYRQQQSLANYEKDRALLKEGEPCPVCLSTDHPFRSLEFTPFADKAKAELDAAEDFYKEKQIERNQLVKRHLEVASKIQQLDSGTSGQLTKLKQQLHELELKLAALLPNFEYEDFSRSSSSWLADKLNAFHDELNSKKEIREKLNNLHAQLIEQESSTRQLEMQFKDVQMAELDASKSVQHTQQNLIELKEQFVFHTNNLNALVKKYGHVFSLDKAKSMFEELTEKESIFTVKQTQHTLLDRQLSLDTQSLSQYKKSYTEIIKKETNAKGELEKQKAKLDELITDRRNQFGEKDPVEEKDTFNSHLDKLEETANQNRILFESATKSYSLKEQALKLEKERLKIAVKELEKLTATLEKGILKIGLTSIKELRTGAMSEGEAQSIQTNLDSLKQAEIETKQKLKTTITELKEIKKTPIPEKPKTELEAELKTVEKITNEIQQQIGAIQQQLKDNDDRKKESKELLTQTDEQRKEYNRWMALYDLIGSSDGKKFRVFAQGLTLQKLVQLANVHLENLFGRYFITKRKGEDLELDIVDTYQADNVRSMHTLSGGESFLVSLALALGLSDLAGKNANIKSLFIDEGFGTLDDQTLDLALVTMENLQAKGKTIGIISHVKELKERISTQVRVIKKGGGMSTVEIIG